jgi:hypothetical protein
MKKIYNLFHLESEKTPFDRIYRIKSDVLTLKWRNSSTEYLTIASRKLLPFSKDSIAISNPIL